MDVVKVDTKIDNNDIVLYNIDDIQRIFQISRTNAYQLMNSPGFPTIKLNKKMLVYKDKLEEWISKNSGRTFNY